MRRGRRPPGRRRPPPAPILGSGGAAAPRACEPLGCRGVADGDACNLRGRRCGAAAAHGRRPPGTRLGLALVATGLAGLAFAQQAGPHVTRRNQDLDGPPSPSCFQVCLAATTRTSGQMAAIGARWGDDANGGTNGGGAPGPNSRPWAFDGRRERRGPAPLGLGHRRSRSGPAGRAVRQARHDQLHRHRDRGRGRNALGRPDPLPDTVTDRRGRRPDRPRFLRATSHRRASRASRDADAPAAPRLRARRPGRGTTAS